MKVIQEITLVEINCGECEIVFAVPDRWRKSRVQTGATFWCPNGHPRAYLDSDNKRLQKEIEALKTRLTHAEDQRAAAATEVQKVKRDAAKHAKRAANGVCPCCRRTFANVARHMKGQHPEYVEAAQ